MAGAELLVREGGRRMEHGDEREAHANDVSHWCPLSFPFLNS